MINIRNVINNFILTLDFFIKCAIGAIGDFCWFGHSASFLLVVAQIFMHIYGSKEMKWNERRQRTAALHHLNSRSNGSNNGDSAGTHRRKWIAAKQFDPAPSTHRDRRVGLPPCDDRCILCESAQTNQTNEPNDLRCVMGCCCVSFSLFIYYFNALI